jgi:hypothetical protein
MTKVNHAEPTVCAVMLTRDRLEYARRAVEAFRAQTYDPIKRLLLIFNTGGKSLAPLLPGEAEVMFGIPPVGWTIGQLRNEANAIARGDVFAHWDGDVFAHWDDDDLSHPNRIAEQVALLQASGADCVGYREMLFWRECRFCEGGRGNVLPECPECGLKYDPSRITPVGEAYLYSNPDPTYCLGTSLCYWRRAWERNPFSERNGPNPRERGEDREFLRGVDSMGVSSVQFGGVTWEPRMIARIHAGNARHYPVDELVKNSDSWRRVPEWDDHCRTIMEAK